jgi:hypothetical protein
MDNYWSDEDETGENFCLMNVHSKIGLLALKEV